jgi:hypothetical protein
MPSKPEKFGQLYKRDHQLKQLSDRASQLDKANIILQNHLPLQFVNHCRLANIRGHILVVHTDKNQYASLLRFHAKQLCQAVSTTLPQPVTHLEVKVRPSSPIQRQGVTRHATLSKKTAALLESTAADIQDDSLKTALLKLSKRQKS